MLQIDDSFEVRTMEISRTNIDNGNKFDWGKASQDYAKYRDIYPEEFYKKLVELGIGIKGQKVLDIGTGTGVLPRNMYSYGAEWTGTDISEEQIAQAKALSENGGMDIDYFACPAEKLGDIKSGFDVLTACQCYWYFEHEKTAPQFSGLLNEGGKVAFLMMNWLPFEDEIAGKTEELVLKYNPEWTGGGDKMKPMFVPEPYLEYFDVEDSGEFLLNVHFTRESWNGRIRACRGIGASSLTEEQKSEWEKEHLAMLAGYPQEFDIKHYAAYVILKKK